MSYCRQWTCLLGVVFRSGTEQERDLSPVTCLAPLYLLLWTFPSVTTKGWFKSGRVWCQSPCRTEYVSVRDLQSSRIGWRVSVLPRDKRDISFSFKWKTWCMDVGGGESLHIMVTFSVSSGEVSGGSVITHCCSLDCNQSVLIRGEGPGFSKSIIGIWWWFFMLFLFSLCINN